MISIFICFYNTRKLLPGRFFLYLIIHTCYYAYRKVCTNCRCGKAEHNVQDLHDPGFYFVGKILDRPLRSKEEEMEFCFGDQSSDEESRTNDQGKKKGVKAGRMVKFDWIPPNISKALVKHCRFLFPICKPYDFYFVNVTFNRFSRRDPLKYFKSNSDFLPNITGCKQICPRFQVTNIACLYLIYFSLLSCAQTMLLTSLRKKQPELSKHVIQRILLFLK